MEFWNRNCVDAILPETCRRYYRQREAQGVSNGTVRKELGTLRAAVNHDAKEGRLVAAPFVWLPSKPPARDIWLSRTGVALLLLEARKSSRSRSHLPMFVLLGLYTAARKGAILDLQWGQIDFVRSRIDLNPAGRHQTTKGRPIIPVPRGLLWFLKKAQARASSNWVLSYEGERLRDIKRSFRAACDRAAQAAELRATQAHDRSMREEWLQIASTLRATTPHTLRHTAATWLAQGGVHMHEIAGWLGHSAQRTTELYAHQHPDYLQNARRALD
jgi:integrase